MCSLIVFTKFEKFLAIISSDILSAPLFLFFWDSHYVYVGLFDVPQVSEALFSFLSVSQTG